MRRVSRLLSLLAASEQHVEELRRGVLPSKVNPVVGIAKLHITHVIAPMSSEQCNSLKVPEMTASTKVAVDAFWAHPLLQPYRALEHSALLYVPFVSGSAYAAGQVSSDTLAVLGGNVIALLRELKAVEKRDCTVNIGKTVDAEVLLASLGWVKRTGDAAMDAEAILRAIVGAVYAGQGLHIAAQFVADFVLTE